MNISKLAIREFQISIFPIIKKTPKRKFKTVKINNKMPNILDVIDLRKIK
jgi:hypothetical protein